MASNDYVFLTEWTIDGPRELIYDIMIDGADLPRWWPDVYLSAEADPPNAAPGVGVKLKLHTRGWLPYTLRWTAETVMADRPGGFTITATGDFEGRGIWTFEPVGNRTHVTFDWRLRAEKPILRTLSFALKPLFAWNHRWAMARGYESLQREVARRLAAQTAVMTV